MMGEWSVGQWIVGVISFQKMYGLYGLKHSGDKWRCYRCGTDGTGQQVNIGLLSF